ncbi:BRO-N domain-containing protein [Chromobacterium vaccinii]|uniref:Transcriptional regulator n=1 Tax=Chromobacterium vaccinii TaxID=1108595 RepID=A0A1D9LCB4_9NEIS|nr:Bro-N domain-containing protein [Chromobacterium vaccinii]AOZ48902.1 transcriptional regulator [Chromobacterium vaccinii]
MQFAHTAVLSFQEVEFDVVDIHNRPWLRGQQISVALGYSRADQASDLFNRNADEFTEDMTQVVDLQTAGGSQSVRIFSPRGCYLLGMFARTERARDFRRWVLDVLEGHAAPRVGATMSQSQFMAALKYRRTLVRDLASVQARGAAVELYSDLVQLSRMLGKGVGSLEDLAPALKQQSLPV